MKIRQTVRHWAMKQALSVPILGDVTHDKLVDLHVSIFLDYADESHREKRRDHLADLFDATVDTYLAALRSGYPEAAAREITHVQANFDFYNHGWTEMMEFPANELEAHYERYRDFFEAHEITISDPLGEFRPAGGIASAPSTPEKLENPEHPHAKGGFADDVYVEGPDGDVHVGGTAAEPADVSPTDAPGVQTDEVNATREPDADD